MANARKYAIICGGDRVLSGATYAQACKMFDAMHLMLTYVRKIRDRDNLDFDLPLLVLCVDI